MAAFNAGVDVLKGPFPNSFLLLFSQQSNVKNDPDNVWCKDLISQPVEHESPSITTVPELPPLL